MSKFKTPVIYDNDKHLPLPDGQCIAVPAIPLGSGENLLKAVEDGLVVDLSLKYHGGVIDFMNGDEVVSSVPVPGNPGLPTVVEILDDFTPPGLPKSTYLHLRFVLADGEEKDVYYDVSHLVDVYTGGPGIAVNGNAISVRLSTDTRALMFDKAGGLIVNADALVSPAKGNGIRMVDGLLFAEVSLSPGKLTAPLYLDDNGNIAIKIDPDGPLIVTKSGLSVDISKITHGVSADEDNILALGSDNLPYFPGDQGKL